MAESRISNHAGFIWSVADMLRGDYKQSEYGKVILPLTVLRRLDCVLEPTKPAVQPAFGPQLRRGLAARPDGRQPASPTTAVTLASAMGCSPGVCS